MAVSSVGVDFWEQVIATGTRLPEGHSLISLTEELTRMLGHPDAAIRDELALTIMTTWVDGGIYDDLLVGLGDGMTEGLLVELGSRDGSSLFRRCNSAKVLGACLRRSRVTGLLPSSTVMSWGDAILTWWQYEANLQPVATDPGPLTAISVGAETLTQLLHSPYFGAEEQELVLYQLSERVQAPSADQFTWLDIDAIAATCTEVVVGDKLSLDQLEAWVGSIVPTQQRGPITAPQLLLRSFYLQLGLTGARPATRTDLLLTTIEALRTTNPFLFK